MVLPINVLNGSGINGEVPKVGKLRQAFPQVCVNTSQK